MDKISTILIIIIVVLLIGNISLGVGFYLTQQQMKVIESKLEAHRVNQSIVEFNKLFIDKVLETQGVVSYEDRLRLEKAVLDTQDQEIANQWQKFLASASEAEAQQSARELLKLFANKITY